VAEARQLLDRDVAQGADERARLGMGVDDQDLQVRTSAGGCTPECLFSSTGIATLPQASNGISAKPWCVRSGGAGL